MKWSDAYEHSGWTIVVPVKLIHAIGAKGAILVAQLFYWKGRQQNPDGWIYKTKEEWESETGLSRHKQDTITRDLKKLGLVEIRYQRLDHRLYYRIRMDVLDGIMKPDAQEERLQTLRSMSYQEYLQTPDWQPRRRQKLKEAQYQCQLCNDSASLQVHHRTYDSRGNEPSSDLIVLRDDCHGKFHDIGTAQEVANVH